MKINSQWHVSSVSLKKETLGQRPTFIQPISSCRVCSGETVRFQARVSGMPKPEIQWFHNEQLMLPTKDIVFHFDESTGTAILLIVDAFLEHAGQYSCKARNSAGEACSTHLRVTGWQLHVPSKCKFPLHTTIAFEYVQSILGGSKERKKPH
uniref:Ig-like domain-containing protein n=1 Tax=Crocodylus porosus TaxID=8502 RepID=A0A7M4F6H9_CROPO